MKEGFVLSYSGVTNGGMAVMDICRFLKRVVLTGAAGFMTILAMLLYLKLLGRPIIDRAFVS